MFEVRVFESTELYLMTEERIDIQNSAIKKLKKNSHNRECCTLDTILASKNNTQLL